MPNPSTSKFYKILLASILFVGLGLRGMGFIWNTRLYGDVNLFALTARQVAQGHGLSYPMKYGFYVGLPYQTLETPAGQHPPLWPLAAGWLARIAGTTDTFTLLKLLSELVGVGLVALVVWRSRNKPDPVFHLTVIGLVCFSPWLVDFSSNGSPYILISLILFIAWFWWKDWNNQQPIHPILAGLVSAAGLLTHGILILLPLFFLVSYARNGLTRRSTLQRCGVFLATLGLALLPWLLWNWSHFGRPFYSLSTYYLYEQLGLTQTRVQTGEVITQVNQGFSANLITRYLELAAKSAYALIRQYLSILAPFGLLLLANSFFWMVRTKRDERSSLVSDLVDFLISPLTLYLLTLLIWATSKTRFILPLLPITYWIMAEGFVKAVRQSQIWRWISTGVLAGFFISLLSFYFQPIAGLYYGSDTPATARLYDQMQPLAVKLGQVPDRVVLGLSETLDGGIETVYWSGQRFIAGRGLSREAIQKITTDFDVSTIWVDNKTRPVIQPLFPQAQSLFKYGIFEIFTLK